MGHIGWATSENGFQYKVLTRTGMYFTSNIAILTLCICNEAVIGMYFENGSNGSNGSMDDGGSARIQPLADAGLPQVVLAGLPLAEPMLQALLQHRGKRQRCGSADLDNITVQVAVLRGPSPVIRMRRAFTRTVFGDEEIPITRKAACTADIAALCCDRKLADRHTVSCMPLRSASACL